MKDNQLVQPVRPTIVAQSNYKKDWVATTHYPLNNGMQLRVSTGLSPSGLKTYCQAVNVKEGRENFKIMGDFRKTLSVYSFKKVNTEKVITDAHKLSLQSIAAVLEEANAFYKK